MTFAILSLEEVTKGISICLSAFKIIMLIAQRACCCLYTIRIYLVISIIKISTMKSVHLKTNHFFLGMLAFVLLSITSACSRKANFQTSVVVPAARGSVKVKKDKNHNHQISVNLFNLAEPERLQPPKKTYVVWMVTDENMTKNLGQIHMGTKLFSKTLKGSFTTQSSFKPVKIFITAEDEADIQYPGMFTVLSTNNF